jgi:hypothetical protein
VAAGKKLLSAKKEKREKQENGNTYWRQIQRKTERLAGKGRKAKRQRWFRREE